MGEKIHQHIRSNVVGYLALFVALSGTAYAANTVGSSDIIDESILSQDIKNGEVKNPDLGANSVGTGKIIDGTVRSGDVADDTTGSALTGTDIADNALTGTDIADNALTGTDIADKSILTGDIGFATITGANISDGSITGADVGFGSLTGSDVANSSLTGSDIAPGSLSGSDIADTNSIGGAEIDESNLALPFRAIDDGPDAGECEGVLSSGKEACADIDSLTVLPPITTRIFIVASGGWSKELGDPADSECDIFVSGPQSAIEAELFMGDNTGFGGGHSSTSAAMPFTLNATTDRLQAGTYRVELGCADNSSGDQDTFIHDAHISALALPAEGP